MNDKTTGSDLPWLSPHATPDPLRQVEEAGFWLKAYRQGVRADPLRVYQVVDRLDERVQSDRLELTREYLGSGGRQQSYREQRIWHAVVRLSRELAAGYETSLQLFQAGEPNSDAVAPFIPSITARAMRALTVLLRWTLLRYSAVEPAFWSRMGALFAYGEHERFMNQSFMVYPGIVGDSTLRREYLRALVFAVSGAENLLPGSQVVAEHVIDSVAEFFLLHRRPAAGCHFGVDLLASRPPFRLAEGIAPSRNVRFFGPGDAAVMVERLIHRTTETGLPPPELSLMGNFDAGTVLEVLQHLSRHWSPNPPSRGEDRKSVLSTLNVAHGFDDVLAVVSAEQGSSGFDEITEAWTVENESTGGFGAALPARDGDWLAIGALIASKPTWPGAWSVGVIRRLSTDDTGRRAVGVQVITRGGVAVELSPFPFGKADKTCFGLLVPAQSQTNLISGEVTLLLPPRAVSCSSSYVMRIHERSYAVDAGRVVESGSGFDVVSFAIRPG